MVVLLDIFKGDRDAGGHDDNAGHGGRRSVVCCEGENGAREDKGEG